MSNQAQIPVPQQAPVPVSPESNQASTYSLNLTLSAPHPGFHVGRAAASPRARSAITGRFVSPGVPERRPRRRSATIHGDRRRRRSTTLATLARLRRLAQDAQGSTDQDSLQAQEAGAEDGHADDVHGGEEDVKEESPEEQSPKEESPKRQSPKEQTHSGSSSNSTRRAKRRRFNRNFTIYDDGIPEVSPSDGSTVILDPGEQQGRAPRDFVHGGNNPEQEGAGGAPRSPPPTGLPHHSDANGNDDNGDGDEEDFVVPANGSDPPSPSPLPHPLRPEGLFERCTSPLCPVPTLHDRGLYLHEGRLPRRYRFGMSNPPPEVWEMVDRLQEGIEQPGDQEVVDAFSRNHRFQGEIWCD
ncbi:hypothetical protein MMC07_003154 [Pseudocyphellaria aurata]|nr:hypothetical protein [Pseudocyphellaria aurata]